MNERRRIAALRRLAASTTFPAERDSALAKARELEARAPAPVAGRTVRSAIEDEIRAGGRGPFSWDEEHRADDAAYHAAWRRARDAWSAANPAAPASVTFRGGSVSGVVITEELERLLAAFGAGRRSGRPFRVERVTVNGAPADGAIFTVRFGD